MFGPGLGLSLIGLFIVFAVQTVVLQATTSLYNRVVGAESHRAVAEPEFNDGIQIVLVIAFFSMVVGFALDRSLGNEGLLQGTGSFAVNLAIIATALRLMLPTPDWLSAGVLALGYKLLTVILVFALALYGGALGSLASGVF